MSLYDRVIFRCPNCRSRLEKRTKAGECHLLTFDQDFVPVEIAGDINGQTITCNNCDQTHKITITYKPVTTLTMELR